LEITEALTNVLLKWDQTLHSTYLLQLD